MGCIAVLKIEILLVISTLLLWYHIVFVFRCDLGLVCCPQPGTKPVLIKKTPADFEIELNPSNLCPDLSNGLFVIERVTCDHASRLMPDYLHPHVHLKVKNSGLLFCTFSAKTHNCVVSTVGVAHPEMETNFHSSRLCTPAQSFARFPSLMQ